MELSGGERFENHRRNTAKGKHGLRSHAVKWGSVAALGKPLHSLLAEIRLYPYTLPETRLARVKCDLMLNHFY